MPSAATPSTPPSSFVRRHPRALRLATLVLSPAIFLLLLELVLRTAGLGAPTCFFLCGEGGAVCRSNFEFARVALGPKLARPPIPMVVSRRADEGSFRIFVFGASAAKGFPNEAFSFARLLEAMLNDRFPDTRFAVINTAVTAINSHLVLPIVRECGAFDADLYVVYLGNNEVVGPHGPGTVFAGFSDSMAAIRFGAWVRSTRTGQLMSALLGRWGAGGDRPERWRGMQMFVQHEVARDDSRLAGTYANFRRNLADMCAAASARGVPVLLCTVVTNLKDTPPFASRHRRDVPEDRRQRWADIFAGAQSLRASGDYDGAIEAYREAERIDGARADLHYYLGRCLLGVGRDVEARRHYALARDHDVLRFRADTAINDTIRAVAGEHADAGVHLVDTERAAAEHGLPGDDLLYEHVHLNFRGNHLVAAALFRRIVSLLPVAIAGQEPDDAPPNRVDCERLVLFSDFFRYDNALVIAGVTGKAPFGELTGARKRVEVERLEASLRPERIDESIERYLAAVRAQPEDLLTRKNLVFMLIYRNRMAEAIGHLDELLLRFPDATSWRKQRASVQRLLREGRRARPGVNARSRPP